MGQRKLSELYMREWDHGGYISGKGDDMLMADMTIC